VKQSSIPIGQKAGHLRSEKNLFPCWESNYDYSVVHPALQSLYQMTYPGSSQNLNAQNQSVSIELAFAQAFFTKQIFHLLDVIYVTKQA
jgi:hypothetical protein